MDAVSILLENIGLYIPYIALIGGMVIIAFIIYHILDSTYPRVVFRLENGKNARYTTRRVMAGTKLLPDNLVVCYFEGEKMLGEDFTRFESIEEISGGFFTKIRKVYPATKIGPLLFPLEIVNKLPKEQQNALKSREILIPIPPHEVPSYGFREAVAAVDLSALRVNNWYKARMLAEKKNILMTVIVPMLVVCLLALILMLGVYFTADTTGQHFEKATKTLAEAIRGYDTKDYSGLDKLDNSTTAKPNNVVPQLNIPGNTQRINVTR